MKKALLITLTLVFGLQILCSQELAKVREDGKFGYINKKVEFIIKPQFKKANSFADGVALVLDGKKWGYINPDGKWLLEPQFDKAKDFDGGVALVVKDKKWMYIDKLGKELNLSSAEKLYPFNDGVAFIRADKMVGLMNPKGEVIAKPTYKIIKGFQNGYARFANQSGQWGIIDNKGNIVIKPEYTSIGNYVNGVARAEKGENVFGIATAESFKKVDGATKIWDFREGGRYTIAEKNEKIGFVDKQGAWVIEPQFEKAKTFENGYAGVFNGNKWGFIDTNGKVVIEYQYDDVDFFDVNGLAPVKIEEWGFVNTKGELVIETKYGITAGSFGFLSGRVAEKGFVDGLARVKYNKQWGFLMPDGKLLGDKWFENAEPFVKIK
ncbi:WG repeat-containing protein [Aquimarina sp. M1]